MAGIMSCFPRTPAVTRDQLKYFDWNCRSSDGTLVAAPVVVEIKEDDQSSASGERNVSRNGGADEEDGFSVGSPVVVTSKPAMESLLADPAKMLPSTSGFPFGSPYIGSHLFPHRWI